MPKKKDKKKNQSHTVLSESSAAPADDGRPGYYLTADSLHAQAIKSRIDYTEPGNWIPFCIFQQFDAVPDGSEKRAALRGRPLTAELAQDVIHLLEHPDFQQTFYLFSRILTFHVQAALSKR